MRLLACLTFLVPLTTLARAPLVAAQECDVRGAVERPVADAVITDQPITISGWAADVAAPNGTGIDEVRVALDADPWAGGVPLPALYGWERPDVADLLGTPRFRPSGFALAWDPTGVLPGRHTLYIQARSACGWIRSTRNVVVIGPRAPSLGAPPSNSPAWGAPAIPAPGTISPSTPAAAR
ncbi:MAG TPA: hypothetical protein VK066_23720 [Chloroflexota bacterium]|nr:hypothetical protein [Chloroflexota bacterium]